MEEIEKTYDKILDKIPKELDFGFIAVKNENTKLIILENYNKFPIPFNIESNDDFKFEPNTGNIPKLGKIEIKVKIYPQSAIVSVGNAQIILGKDTSRKARIIKLCAISKYPYLKIHKNILDFGNVVIGKTKELELIINNPEKVEAKFNIEKKKFIHAKSIEQFYVSDLSGIVPPESSFLLKIKYVTSYPNFFSYETFDILTKGGNVNRFSCIAHSQGLTTNISDKFINFHSVELNTTKTKMIRLFNESDELTYFQFFYNNDHVFFFDELEGVIPAKSNVRVTITFKPNETVSYYDRIFCLIKNHFLFAIDICGSCHDLLIKPKIISQKHIDIFRYKSTNGFYVTQKFSLNIQSKEFDFSNYIDTITRGTKKTTFKSVNDNDEGLIDFSNQIQLHKEILWENTSNTRLFTSNTEMIDFRFVESGKLSEPYLITIFNNSGEKLKVKWLLDKPVMTNNLTKAYNLFSFENINFIVTPEEGIINRKSSMEFKVFFKPNKPEYYFFSNLTCLGTLQTNYDNQKIDTSKSFDLTKNNLNTQKTISSLGYRTNLLKSMSKPEKSFEYFDPPYPLKISVVGHSFPPNTQIFMPMLELIPKKQIIFSPCSIFQSCYQTLIIKNNSDTPLYYKFMNDISSVFRIFPKNGIVKAKNFNLILIEFCPIEIKSYIFPLKIVFNHDSLNMNSILLNGLCCDPLIEVEGIHEEICFPPSFIGISTSKSINIMNKSPIKVNVQISSVNTGNGIVNLEPSYFEMEANQIRKIEVYLCPLKIGDVESKVEINVGRIYDPINELFGIYNPGFTAGKVNQKSDKRLFKKVLKITGKGNDGEVIIDPPTLDFGTVKVGFHKKLTFSIFNPTICNFYVKMMLEDEAKEYDSVINLDFREGILNSLCKKDVNIMFHPNNRSNLEIVISLYAMENKSDKITQNMVSSVNFEAQKTLKAQIRIKANGDYPLLKITDIRNSNIGVSKLWQSFKVDDANEELLKKLTEEEINFINNEKTNNKLQDYYEKLKCVKFDFGKHILHKKSKDFNSKQNNYIDIYLTLKNVGGVLSEFYFKFPDDISIKRETWMDVVEASSNETKEYQVLKNNIFDIYPRKNRLEPNELCNIRFRYDIKQIGEHRLRVIFQIVNGKPLVFELCAETHSEKKGILEIRNPVLDFLYVPMGYMIPVVCPLEIRNVGGIKIRYKINETAINQYNTKNDDFPVFKLENVEGPLGPNEVTYIIGAFRPLTNKEYKVSVPIEYTDGINGVIEDIIILSGFGFNPKSMKLPKIKSIFFEMPKLRQYNLFENNIIQKCGVSLEELDFGSMADGISSSQTFILYNYSLNDSFNFEFFNPGFNMKDEIIIEPLKGRLEPNSHLILKIKLIPKYGLSNYEGELEIKIFWQSQGENSKISTEKENLFIRLAKKACLKDIPGKIEQTINPNASFIEAILDDCIKEIICDKDFDDLLTERLDQQPISLYEFTNNQNYISHEDIKSKIINNYLNITISSINDLNTSNIMSTKRSLMQQQRNISSKESTHSKSKEMEENRIRRAQLLDIYKDLDANFNEGEDLKMEDKYMKELIGKMGYSTKEVNEKILLVNEESKNFIHMVLENTFFNIISEAVFAETDLSEQSKIFFLKKP